jgi:tetratricopeptide (TPR) repeat protein
MDLQSVKSDLQALKSFLADMKPIKRILGQIHFDSARSSDPNWQVAAIIDFTDIHRYLHPILDQTAYLFPNRFTSEQLALEYLFSDRPFDLYLLSEYLDEYRSILRQSHVSLISASEKPEKEIQGQMIRLDRNLLSLLGVETKKRVKTEEEILSKSILRSDLPMLEYAFDNVKTKLLQYGIQQFHALTEQNVIRNATQIGGVTWDDLNPSDSREYKILLERLRRIKPNSPKQNETDARAFWITLRLNKNYFHKKKLFLFVTSATSMAKAFDGVDVFDHLGNRDLHESMEENSIIRTPEYLLLRYFLQSSEFAKTSIDASGFLDLVSRYCEVAGRLDGYFDGAIEIGDIHDLSFVQRLEEASNLRRDLIPYMEDLREFGKSTQKPGSLYSTLGSRLKIPSFLHEKEMGLGEIRAKISDALKDPKVVLSHYKNAAKKLSGAIGKLEIGMVPFVNVTKGYVFVYPIHKLESTNKDIKRIADAIVQALAKRSEEGFVEAFTELSALRTRHPNLSDTLVLSSKVYRAAGSFREALLFSKAAIKKSPRSVEAQFEISLCYRKIAENESSFLLIHRSWQHCNIANEIDPSDARVLREISYLKWLALENKWNLPTTSPDPVMDLVESARSALVRACEEYGEFDRITLTVMNDLAYFLAMTIEPILLEESIQLCNNILKNQKKMQQSVLSSVKDTKGFSMMQSYKLKDPENRDSSMIEDAAVLIREAYDTGESKSVRRKHFEEVMKLVLDSRLN